MTATIELAWQALRGFVDPCSDGMGRPVSVVDLGLIETIRIDATGHRVDVDFCPTGPSCFFQIPMIQQIEQLVTEATGLDCVVRISDEIWTPDRMATSTQTRRPLQPARDPATS